MLPPSIARSSYIRSRRLFFPWPMTSASIFSSSGKKRSSIFRVSISRETKRRPGGMSSTASRRREEDGALENVMDYLFVRLILRDKELGFRRFNLGMAPLSAVGEVRWAKPFERAAHLFFRHGEPWYNYQGLRRYKEKFDPVWEPRYMAYPKPWDWPLATTSTALLIAGGGGRGLLPSRGTT